jgi:hypothetical protein
MPVEDHPQFPHWKKALEHLIAAKEHLDCVAEAQKGIAKMDYDKALAAYCKIADEL